MSRQNTSSDLGRQASSASLLKQKSASFSTSAEASAAVEQYRRLVLRRNELQLSIQKLRGKLVEKSDMVDPGSVPEALRARVIQENEQQRVDFERYEALCRELEELSDAIYAMKKPGGFSVQAALSFSGSVDDQGMSGVPATFDDVAGAPLPSPREASDSITSPDIKTGLGSRSCVFSSSVSSQLGRSPEVSFALPPALGSVGQ